MHFINNGVHLMWPNAALRTIIMRDPRKEINAGSSNKVVSLIIDNWELLITQRLNFSGLLKPFKNPTKTSNSNSCSQCRLSVSARLPGRALIITTDILLIARHKQSKQLCTPAPCLSVIKEVKIDRNGENSSPWKKYWDQREKLIFCSVI